MANTTGQKVTTQASTRAFAEEYIGRGWAVIPQTPPKPGAASDPNPPKGWNTKTFGVGDFRDTDNVAIRLDNLADVDLDWPEARVIADRLAADWSCVYGRESSRGGHRLVSCLDLKKNAKGNAKLDFKLPASVKDDPRLPAEHDLCVVEIASGPGHKAVAPPSLHRSGERVEWRRGTIGQPPEVEPGELRQRVGLIAFLAVVARCWPRQGGRHNSSLALAGTLLRAGYDMRDVQGHVQTVAEVAHDDEADERAANVPGTAERLEAGHEVTGLTSLIECLSLPKTLQQTFRRWLELEDISTNKNPDMNIRDKSLADRLVAEGMGDDWKFMPERKLWRRYRMPGLWEDQPEGAAENYIAGELQAQSERLDAQAAQCHTGQDAAALNAAANKLQSAAKIDAVVRLVKRDSAMASSADGWDADDWVIGTPDGLIDLRTGQTSLAPASAWITKQPAVSPDSECPTPEFDRFMARIFRSRPELIHYFQVWGGWCLTGDTSADKFLFALGRGGNGKTTLLNTIAGILGDYAATAPNTVFMQQKNEQHPEQVARLEGARMVVSSELNHSEQWNESRLKAFTGGEMLTGRAMFEGTREFEAKGTLAFTGNSKPRLSGVGPAIRRRLQLVKFEEVIGADETVAGLEKKLQAEWPGILAWMVQGCLEYQRNGLPRLACIDEWVAEYLEANDELGEFIEDCLTPDPEAEAAASNVRKRYEKWCEDNHYKAWSQQAFKDGLSERGFTWKRRNVGNKYLGCRLRAPQVPIRAAA